MPDFDLTGVLLDEGEGSTSVVLLAFRILNVSFFSSIFILTLWTLLFICASSKISIAFRHTFRGTVQHTAY